MSRQRYRSLKAVKNRSAARQVRTFGTQRTRLKGELERIQRKPVEPAKAPELPGRESRP